MQCSVQVWMEQLGHLTSSSIAISGHFRLTSQPSSHVSQLSKRVISSQLALWNPTISTCGACALGSFSRFCHPMRPPYPHCVSALPTRKVMTQALVLRAAPGIRRSKYGTYSQGRAFWRHFSIHQRLFSASSIQVSRTS